MKKILLILLFTSFVFVNTFAQELDIVEVGEETYIAKQNEIYITGGTPSAVGLIAGMFGAIFKGIANAANKNGSTTEEDNSLFAISAGYNHFFGEHFGIGTFVTAEQISSITILTAQMKLTGQYGWEHFKLYHSISGGILVTPGGDTISPAFDLTLLGLKFDFEYFNIFLEASAPTTGLIKAGASFKF